jgi:NADH-quinone oxidoreductase subunit H
LFSSPWLALSTLLAVAAQVPLARRVVVFAAGPRPGFWDRALDVAQWTHDLVVSGLLALTLFGGWAPGGRGATAYDTAGAVILLGKTWLLLLGIVLLRWTLGRLDAVRVLRSAWLWLVLPSLGLLALALGSRRLPGAVASAALGQPGAWALCAAIFLALAWLMHRVGRQARSCPKELRVLPWL